MADWYHACHVVKSRSLSAHLSSLYSCAAVLLSFFLFVAVAAAFSFFKWLRLSSSARARVWRLYAITITQHCFV
jgi:hypothetical protein